MKSEIKTVAVVGYTNAGKSTLMNRMLMKFEEESESKIVFEKDMLFATLDTYHRRINLDDNKSIVLIDTVGFVSKLPHALIQAFKATLEEVTEADLLLHLVDVSNENYQMQIDITNEVLKELDVVDKPTVYVFNKTDKVKNQELIPRKENAINASLINNEGLDDVIQAVKTELFSDHIKCKLMIPYKDGNVLSKILENSIVYNQEHKAEGTEIEVELSVIDHSRYAMYEV